jgi:signal transduction histidine kinase/CheY-like chemotaxis protein
MPYVLLAAACGLSGAASWYVSVTARAQAEAEFVGAQAKFQTDAEKTRQQIEFRLNAYIEVVRAAAALIGASSEISGAEFRAFVRGLQLRERYPGMVGIGFAPRVLRADLRQFLRSVSLDSPRTFRMWPSDVQAENQPVLFLEPIDAATRAALGFNLSTDPALMETMQGARDTGQPTTSALLTSPPFGQDEQRVFVLVIPVYGQRTPPETVEARRRSVIGYVFSPFNPEPVLEPLAASTTGTISFEVYETRNSAPTNLLGRSNSITRSARFESTGSVRVAGREWLVVVKSLERPVRTDRPTGRGTLIAGLLLSAILFLITSSQVRAWETASRQEAKLRASAQALRESEAQAQAADRAKDEFLATLSHELRTPLNAILGWVSMLRRGSLPEDRRAHGLVVIERNARLQAQLIEDLLDVSRIVMGKVRLQLRPLPLAPVIAGAVESLRPGADAKGVHLHTSLGDDGVIQGDPDRLQQVVWNLVANAIKFTPAGGHVHVTLSRKQHHVHISVRDTGIGIDPAFLPHVFERFRQADSSTTRPHSGIGIGLSIVQHLVELHGGSIEVRSAGRDYGTEFVIQLPMTAAASGISAVALAGGTSHPFTTILEGVRVLVVDDDPDTRELLTDVLGTLGAKVTAVDSAQHALQRLITQGTDVIVSDIAMPDEDGLSLIRQVRALPGPLGRVPAIALTAFARADDRARAIEAGYQLHLAKPVELAELQAGLATLTGSRLASG